MSYDPANKEQQNAENKMVFGWIIVLLTFVIFIIYLLAQGD